MNFFGWMSFMILMFYSSYPGRVKKLEKKIKNLERKINGGTEMSRILNGLIGKKCKISKSELSSGITCTIVDVDDEFVTYSVADKKDTTKTSIMRIDLIENIDILE